MTEHPALFGIAPADPPKQKRNRSGVEAAVRRQIRRLEQLEVIEAGAHSRQAGLVAQAISLGASIDREDGSKPDRRQASGVSLAALHERLAAILDRLDPQAEADDDAEWTAALEEMRRTPQLEPPPGS